MKYLVSALALITLSASFVANAQENKRKALDVSLQEAYKKEFAFLAGQKRELSDRKKKVQSRSRSEANRSQANISKLEGQLLSLESRLKQQREAIRIAEQASLSKQDDSLLVDSTVDQASTTLRDYGIELEKRTPENRLDLLAAVFDKSIAKLNELASIRKEEGAFFTRAGNKTEGTIIKVGQIGAYGISPEEAGVLAPAGNGNYKVWAKPAVETAQALNSNEQPENISIFLYESLNEAVQEDKGETAIEHVAAGGAIAWVIVGLGLFGLLMVAVRSILLFLAGSNTARVEKEIGQLVAEGNVLEAEKRAASISGSTARAVTSVLAGLQKAKD